jgi:hypothetical protein
MTIEKQVMELIATDRLYIPLSSMEGKLKRARPKLAKDIDLGEENCFFGERVYARIEAEDKNKARGVKAGIDQFCESFPKYGRILKGYIEEKRTLSETHLYFGTNPNCKLTANDYIGVMANLGFTEQTSLRLYPELMEVSRKLSRKRNEERSVLIGGEED